MDDFFAWASRHINEISTMLAGIFGSATASLMSDIKTSKEKLIAFLVGTGAVYAGADWVVIYFGIDARLAGWLVGVSAYNLTSAVIKIMQRFGNTADFWTLLRDSVMHFFARKSCIVNPIIPDREE